MSGRQPETTPAYRSWSRPRRVARNRRQSRRRSASGPRPRQARHLRPAWRLARPAGRARHRGHDRIRRKTLVKNRKPSSISVLNNCHCARGSDGQRRRAFSLGGSTATANPKTAWKRWVRQVQNQGGLAHSSGMAVRPSPNPGFPANAVEPAVPGDIGHGARADHCGCGHALKDASHVAGVERPAHRPPRPTLRSNSPSVISAAAVQASIWRQVSGAM